MVNVGVKCKSNVKHCSNLNIPFMSGILMCSDSSVSSDNTGHANGFYFNGRHETDLSYELRCGVCQIDTLVNR